MFPTLFGVYIYVKGVQTKLLSLVLQPFVIY